MADALQADINIATHSAFQQMGALMASVDNARASLDTLDVTVRKAEADAGKMAEEFRKAEEQFKQTGAAADQMKMEEARAAMTDASKRAADLRGNYED